MHQRFGAGRPRGLRHMSRALVLHRLESLLAGRKQDADEIDDGVGAVGGGKERIGKAHIGLHGVDLPHAAQRLEVEGKLWAPHRHPHARAGLGNGPHHVAPDEARAAIDGDQRRFVEFDRHVVAPCAPIVRLRSNTRVGRAL
jgi:hypothetical protein